MTNKRTRMIVELTPDVLLAIKLRSAKDAVTTGAVVCEAICKTFSKDVEEAKTAMREKRMAKAS